MSDVSVTARQRGRAITWAMLVVVALTGAIAAAMSQRGQDRLSTFWNAAALYLSSPGAAIPDSMRSLATEQRLAAIEAALQRIQDKTIQTSDELKDLQVAYAGVQEQLTLSAGSSKPTLSTTVLTRNPVRAVGTSSGTVDVKLVPLDTSAISADDQPEVPPVPQFATPMVNMAITADPEETTGSLPKNSGAPAPIPVPTVLVTDFGIELSRAATIDELEREWKRISASQKDITQHLEPRISLDFSGGSSAKLVLIAGPIRNAADAARVCAMMASTGQSCRPVPFGEDTVALNGQP